MALFYYQALERNGRKTKGMIEADPAHKNHGQVLPCWK